MTKFKKLAVVGVTAAMTMAMSIAAFASTTVTVHFKNAANWDNVGAWAFEGVAFTTPVMPADKCPAYNTTTERAIWPGAKLEAEAEYDGWYSLDFTFEDTSTGAVFIFNNLVADTKADTSSGGDATDQQFLDAAAAKGLICDSTKKQQTPNQVIVPRNFTEKEYWCDFDGNTKGSTAQLLSTKPASYVKKASTTVSGLVGVGATDKSIRLTWDKYDGADSYTVVYYNSAKKAWKKVADTTGAKCIVKKVGGSAIKTGTKYRFQVWAYKNKKKVAKSTDVYAAALKVPTITKVANASGKVKITIGKVSGASGYVIYRATSKNGAYVAIGSTTTTSYADKLVKSGKTYYYKVSAFKKNGNSKMEGAMSSTYKSIKYKK